MLKSEKGSDTSFFWPFIAQCLVYLVQSTNEPYVTNHFGEKWWKLRISEKFFLDVIYYLHSIKQTIRADLSFQSILAKRLIGIGFFSNSND